MAQPVIHLVPRWPPAGERVSVNPNAEPAAPFGFRCEAGCTFVGLITDIDEKARWTRELCPNDASPLKRDRWSGLAARPNDPVVEDS